MVVEPTSSVGVCVCPAAAGSPYQSKPRASAPVARSPTTGHLVGGNQRQPPVLPTSVSRGARSERADGAADAEMLVLGLLSSIRM